jgi:hypothetical protein
MAAHVPLFDPSSLLWSRPLSAWHSSALPLWLLEQLQQNGLAVQRGSGRSAAASLQLHRAAMLLMSAGKDVMARAVGDLTRPIFSVSI